MPLGGGRRPAAGSRADAARREIRPAARRYTLRASQPHPSPPACSLPPRPSALSPLSRVKRGKRGTAAHLHRFPLVLAERAEPAEPAAAFPWFPPVPTGGGRRRGAQGNGRNAVPRSAGSLRSHAERSTRAGGGRSRALVEHRRCSIRFQVWPFPMQLAPSARAVARRRAVRSRPRRSRRARRVQLVTLAFRACARVQLARAERGERAAACNS